MCSFLITFHIGVSCRFLFQIYYDSDFKLVRYDLVNIQPVPPAYTSDPMSTIHDYKSGITQLCIDVFSYKLLS